MVTRLDCHVTCGYNASMTTLREIDLKKLNSITRYPSIPTYHKIDTKDGRLLPTTPIQFSGWVHASEQIDGTNARIILVNDEYVIGSREDFLHASGDLIPNEAMGIVACVKNLAENLASNEDFLSNMAVVTLYGEVYGGNVTSASKQYTKNKRWGFRLFDISYVSTEDEFKELLSWPHDAFSGWRDRCGQKFLHTNSLRKVSRDFDIDLAPGLEGLDAESLPTTIGDTYEFLRKRITTTKANLDGEDEGKPEGIVLRSEDRSAIAKLRFEDYERTLRKR